jgi:O-glycosyl hydrolase
VSTAQQTVLRVDATRTYQTIENFGASDAWSCQFIGGWPEEKKNAMADWLFSLDTMEDGRPKGIGLTLWRTNIGAGSADQGDSSGIRDVWRRAAGVSSGQLWFLNAARSRGVGKFLGFLNSPPVWLTKNGRAYSSVAGVSNIGAGRYKDFSEYMVGAIKQIRQATGVRLDYISPVNEPQWDWSDGGQEGCPYRNDEISGLVRMLSEVLKRDVPDTKIVVPESGHLKYILADGDKPGRGNQLAAFFSPSSPNYIGGLDNVEKLVAAHSYFSTLHWLLV